MLMRGTEAIWKSVPEGEAKRKKEKIPGNRISLPVRAWAAEASSHDLAGAELLRDDRRSALRILPEAERHAAEMRFGLGHRLLTFEEVGRCFGVTREWPGSLNVEPWHAGARPRRRVSWQNT